MPVIESTPEMAAPSGSSGYTGSRQLPGDRVVIRKCYRKRRKITLILA